MTCAKPHSEWEVGAEFKFRWSDQQTMPVSVCHPLSLCSQSRSGLPVQPKRLRDPHSVPLLSSAPELQAHIPNYLLDTFSHASTGTWVANRPEPSILLLCRCSYLRRGPGCPLGVLPPQIQILAMLVVFICSGCHDKRTLGGLNNRRLFSPRSGD